MRAYGNRMTIAKFTDKTILTLTDHSADLITASGRNVHLSLDSGGQHEYGHYLTAGWHFHQRVFDPEGFQRRVELNDMIAHQRQASEVFVKAGSYFNQR